MQAKERASRACHMCQRSGCAAGAARRTAPSASAHEFGRFRAFQTSTSGPEILVASLFSALVVCFGCFRCSTTSYNQNKQRTAALINLQNITTKTSFKEQQPSRPLINLQGITTETSFWNTRFDSMSVSGTLQNRLGVCVFVNFYVSLSVGIFFIFK